MRVALDKVNGVASVNVTLKRGVAHLDLRPGNTVSLPQLRRIIKDAGYTTRDALVTARGVVSLRDGKLVLEVTGTSTVLALESDPAHAGALASLQKSAAAGARIRVDATGVVPAPADPKAADVLVLRSFTLDP